MASTRVRKAPAAEVDRKAARVAEENYFERLAANMVEEVNRDIPSLVDQGLDTVKKYKIKVRPLTREDFDAAARLIHPQTTKEEMQKYYNWKESAEER